MHPLKLRVLRFAARMAAAAAIAAFAITSCNLPKPTPSGNQGSDTGGTYGTNQQSLKGAGENSDDYGYECTKDMQWYLYFNHKYHVAISESDYTVTMTGDAYIVQENGNLTGTGSKGFFQMEGKSGEDCTYIATAEFSANISGRCDYNRMILNIEEMIGKGGYIEGQLICIESNGEQKKVDTKYGYPPMNHPDIVIELWTNETEGVHGEKSIPWGTSGSKSWEVSTILRLVEPTERP